MMALSHLMARFRPSLNGHQSPTRGLQCAMWVAVWWRSRLHILITKLCNKPYNRTAAIEYDCLTLHRISRLPIFSDIGSVGARIG